MLHLEKFWPDTAFFLLCRCRALQQDLCVVWGMFGLERQRRQISALAVQDHSLAGLQVRGVKRFWAVSVPCSFLPALWGEKTPKLQMSRKKWQIRKHFLHELCLGLYFLVLAAQAGRSTQVCLCTQIVRKWFLRFTLEMVLENACSLISSTPQDKYWSMYSLLCTEKTWAFW